MQTFMGPDVGIDAQSGTSSHNKIYRMHQASAFSVHLVNDGTLNTGTGWVIEGSNGPNLDNTTASGPATTVFDWVDLGLTITAPDGTAQNQLIIVSDVRVLWVRVRWDSTSMTGSGNVSSSMYMKGIG